MKDIECPYCSHEYDACQDDGHLCSDGDVYEEECPECEKIFQVVPCISYTFSVLRTDCLNDGIHTWGTRSWGTFCSQCGLRKQEKQ